MQFTLLAIATMASAVLADPIPQGWNPRQGQGNWNPYSGQVLYGGKCCQDGLQHCFNQGAWGCIQLAGPNCVDQTTVCDQACGGYGYAYQKDNSDDRRCVCSGFEDAQQSRGYC